MRHVSKYRSSRRRRNSWLAVTRTATSLACLLWALAALGVVSPVAVNANILTKIMREAGEAGGRAARHGLDKLDNVASHIAKLPDSGKGQALAAHATPEGHWKFANKDGEVYTAGSPAELQRVAEVLLPETHADGRLSLYLSDDTVFQHRGLIKDLPDADLHIVASGESYRLRASSRVSPDGFAAEVQPNLVLDLADKALFEEALFRLSRPLKPANFRLLALEPGASRRLSSAPAYDPATRARIVEPVDPNALGAALSKLKGQTVVLSGRVELGRLHFDSASGGTGLISINELMRTAQAADVNMIVLKSSSSVQPGGRNWLWQKIEVAGLDDALRRATFADFLNALGTKRGGLAVSVATAGDGRLVLRAVPTGDSAMPLTDKVGNWLADLVGPVTGSVINNGLEAYVRDQKREREYDARFIPGIPSDIQLVYLGSLIAGIFGFATARAWWARIWPPEERAEYASAFGYHAARVVRVIFFLLIFLPLVGGPALLWTILTQALSIMLAPLRFLAWLWRRGATSPG